MGTQHEEEPRFLWGDEMDEGDEIVVMRNAVLDDTPVPERVKDLPKRQTPKSFSQKIEENDLNDDVDEWTPGSRRGHGGEKILQILEISKVVAAFAVLGGVLLGLGWVVWWAFQQYGVL